MVSHMASPLLRTTLTRAVVRPLAFALGAAVVVVAGTTWAGSGAAELRLDGAEQGSVAAPATAEQRRHQRATALLERHGCWSGETPPDMRGVLPGHVVVSHRVDAEVRTSYAGARLVGEALEELFGDGSREVVAVHGFCR